MGLASPMLGSMTVGDANTGLLSQYMENIILLAQEAEGRFGYNARLLKDPTCNSNFFAKKLTTTIAISDRYGGPGAEVKIIGSSGLETLLDSVTSEPNSPSTKNNSESLRDNDDFFRDVFSAPIEELRKAGKPTNALKDYGVVLVIPIDRAILDPADPNAVLSSEFWEVYPLDKYGIDFRGLEIPMTVIDRKDKTISLQSQWTLNFMHLGETAGQSYDLP